MEQQTEKKSEWSEAVVYTARNVVLPYLDQIGRDGAEGSRVQEDLGLKERMRANCCAYLVDEGLVFHAFRPSGKVGRVARVFVSMKHEGAGSSPMPASGWVSP